MASTKPIVTSQPDKEPQQNTVTREKPVFWGFAVEVYRKGEKPRLRWRWGRISATLCLALILTYAAFSAALFFYIKERRQFDTVTVTQILTWPFNRVSFRVSMGEYFIERGREDLQRGNFAEGFYFLRAGVARAPANREARLILAELYEHGLRRTDMAIDILRRGFVHHLDHVDYLRTTIALMMRSQLDSEIMALADDYLLPETVSITADEDAEPLSETERNQRRWQQTLAFAAAQANYFRGNYDRAEDLLRRFDLDAEVEGIHLRSLLQWARGREVEAIGILEQALRRQGELDRFLVQLGRFHRERGEVDEARRYGVLRAINNPDNPVPRVDLLHSFHLMDDQQRLEAEVESLLRNHGDQEQVVRLIGNFAAETGNEELAQRVYDRAVVSHFDPSNFVLLIIEAHLVAENYTAALALAEEIAAEQPGWMASRLSVFNSLRAIANFGSNRVDLGQLYLNDLYTDRNVRVETLLAVSRRLEQIGFPLRAMEVLRSAYQRDPSNQAALSALIEARIDQQLTAELPDLVNELLQMRRPAPALLRRIRAEISRDHHLFDPRQETVLNQLRGAMAETNS